MLAVMVCVFMFMSGSWQLSHIRHETRQKSQTAGKTTASIKMGNRQPLIPFNGKIMIQTCLKVCELMEAHQSNEETVHISISFDALV